MSWWTSFKEKASAAGSGAANGAQWLWNNATLENASAAGNGMVHGAQWLWNNATLANVSSAAFKFTVNTTFHVLEQGLALRKAVPTLIYNKEARQIVNGFTHVVVHDVLPIVAMNVANNGVQNYFRDGYDENEASAAYSLLISVLTLGNYLVTAYTWRRGTESFVRVAVLDSFAPAAFNSNKTTIPPSLCDELECNTKRRIKGSFRELGILWANEALIAGVSKLPLVGPPVSTALTVVNNGRYITRAATPERCERHKFMELEFVLALGLTYDLASWVMNKGLESTTGPLPWLSLRALNHILIALSVNLASHMAVPLVEPKDATIPDPFHYYERIWRFILDVQWAGLLVRAPIDFKPLPGEQPLVPLSTALQLGTRVFRSDLERDNTTMSYPIVKTIKDYTIPPMFRSSYQFPKDPVLAEYWPAIREGAIAIFTGIEVRGKTTVVKTLTWSPGTAAVILNYELGVPETLTKIALMLSKEKDFWALTNAIKSWLARHPSTIDVRLEQPTTPLLALYGDKPQAHISEILEPNEEVVPVKQLVSDKSPTTVNALVTVSQLVTVRREEEDSGVTEISRLIPSRSSTVVVSADNPSRFMSTRRRKAKIEEVPVDDAALALNH